MKYLSLLFNVMALALLAWGISAVASLKQVKPLQIRPVSSEIKPLVEKDVQEQADILRALKAINALAAQSQQAQSRYSNVPLISQPAPGTPGSDGPLMPDRNVTVLIQGTDEATAVVDGRVVRQGALLDGGGRLSSIKDHHLLVKEKNGRQVLTVPFANLRVGSLYSPDSSPQTQATQFPTAFGGPVTPAPAPSMLQAQGARP